jgi:hypothetical protein
MAQEWGEWRAVFNKVMKLLGSRKNGICGQAERLLAKKDLAPWS